MTAVCSVSAQKTVGDWTVYANYDRTVDNMVDTGSKIYYVTWGMLYSYDYEADETYVYTTYNKMNDNNIIDIRYNYDNKYLLVIYEDYNMDIIYDDGHVVNFPDLMLATTIVDKTINDVQFGDNTIYIAANFGFIIYDSSRHEVKESGVFNSQVSTMMELGDYIVAIIDYKLYKSPKSGRHNTMDMFTPVGGCYAASVHKVSEDTFAYLNGKSIYVITLDFAKGSNSITNTNVSVKGKLYSMKDGSFYIKDTDKNILVFDSTATPLVTIKVPDDMKNDCYAMYESTDKIWFGNGEGVGRFNITGGTTTVLNQRYRHEAFNCKVAAYINSSQDGKRIYFTNLGPTTYLKALIITDGGYDVPQTTSMLKDGKIYDVSIENFNHTISQLTNYQKSYNNTAMYGGSTRMICDPDNEDRYYIGNGREGLVIVEGNQEVMLFNKDNSPLNSSWGTRVYDVNIDPDDNLWVGCWSGDVGESPYIILPAAKRRKDADKIEYSDWKIAKLDASCKGKTDMGSLFCKKSNMAFFWNGTWQSGVTVLDTKGTYDNPSDDKSVTHTSFTDQDGNSFTADYYICGIEDQKGRVWIGTSMGVFEITNPTDAINSSFTINRLKVPRNDGTNYADYLLDTEQINCICTDASDRKWIATEVSGVYLVSEDGDEILEHFTTENSYLPSDAVFSVFCDPLSNEVYFGTANGIASYSSTASPAKEDYSDVYAYPNPVRPDYSGWITVTGLMENSLVKIADAAGNVFYQGRSEGGMVTWDGCNSSGDRVKTGVYYVFASHSGDDSQMGVVTKILVVR
jgi:hypothetical protein